MRSSVLWAARLVVGGSGAAATAIPGGAAAEVVICTTVVAVGSSPNVRANAAAIAGDMYVPNTAAAPLFPAKRQSHCVGRRSPPGGLSESPR